VTTRYLVSCYKILGKNIFACSNGLYPFAGLQELKFVHQA